MPRKCKTQLSKRKYSRCTTLTISIPTAKLRIPPLLNNTAVPSLHSLQQRLTAFSSVPPNWKLVPLHSDGFGLQSHLQTNLQAPVSISLVVQRNFEWNITVGKHRVDHSRGILSEVQAHLCSPFLVLKLIDLLENIHICIGNKEDQFLELVRTRNGVIKSPCK